jgi:hypothetical protein
MSFSQNNSTAKIPYFYSNSHIFGCVYAMIGLMLHYQLELATVPWYTAAVFLYLIGSFIFKDKTVVSSKQPILQTFSKGVSLETTLNKIVLKNQPFLPNDAMDLLTSISTTIGDILPKMESNPDMLPEVHTVRKIIEEYLPVTLSCYIKIPGQYVKDGQLENNTAHRLLIEQLTLLNHYLTEIFKNLVDEDINALISNGRFLKEKFTADDGFNIQ